MAICPPWRLDRRPLAQARKARRKQWHFLEIKNASVGFGAYSDRYEVLEDINLSVDENEFVAIIGFSGSGKSTLMSLLAGLVEPDKGEVLLDGEPCGEPGPDRGIVFQNYSLLPWLSVYGNIELAVKQVFPEMPKVGACRLHPATTSTW